ncbi:hypothetical protein NDU88_003982 [Pleurodeles waltl]|uniref:Uncharacterized protein n=1 Tax=Pleurodeles waltl TaxID=8319 RepID=A0AAV7V279_PLEWA|nr:hypothetical protein NDU88_003982 [Pleurodeles waltl]
MTRRGPDGCIEGDSRAENGVRSVYRTFSPRPAGDLQASRFSGQGEQKQDETQENPGETVLPDFSDCTETEAA